MPEPSIIEQDAQRQTEKTNEELDIVPTEEPELEVPKVEGSEIFLIQELRAKDDKIIKLERDTRTKDQELNSMKAQAQVDSEKYAKFRIDLEEGKARDYRALAREFAEKLTSLKSMSVENLPSVPQVDIIPIRLRAECFHGLCSEFIHIMSKEEYQKAIDIYFTRMYEYVKRGMNITDVEKKKLNERQPEQTQNTQTIPGAR